MKNLYLAWDGERDRLWLVRAADEDSARDVLAGAKDSSDGDEFSVFEVPADLASPADVTDHLM